MVWDVILFAFSIVLFLVINRDRLIYRCVSIAIVITCVEKLIEVSWQPSTEVVLAIVIICVFYIALPPLCWHWEDIKNWFKRKKIEKVETEKVTRNEVIFEDSDWYPAYRVLEPFSVVEILPDILIMKRKAVVSGKIYTKYFAKVQEEKIKEKDISVYFKRKEFKHCPVSMDNGYQYFATDWIKEE